MNILVKTYSGKYTVRPDTTWERDNEDLYVPEFVRSLSYTPVLFARISKPGRSVGEKFADRYFDGIGYGILLYPDDLMDGSMEGFACASCLDHTSFLPFPVGELSCLADESFCLKKNGIHIYNGVSIQDGIIREAIAEATRYIYIRTGDLIAIEMSPMERLCSKDEKECSISADWRGSTILDFKIFF